MIDFSSRVARGAENAARHCTGSSRERWLAVGECGRSADRGGMVGKRGALRSTESSDLLKHSSSISSRAAAVVAAYDFSSSATVVDIGGGDGTLLAAILKGKPQLRRVLADLPHVAEGAQRRFKTEGLADRCEVAPGQFL
jgi:spermidine synthase